MKRSTLNFIVDLISFVVFVVLALSGFIIKYMPHGGGGQGRGFRGGRGPAEGIREFMSMTRHEWGDIHFYLSVLFIAFVLVHLILHWTWIKNYIKSLFGIKRSGKKIENCGNL